jgi:hypothetical protein
MADTDPGTTRADAPPGGKKPGAGKKIAGLPRPVVIGFFVALGGGILYFWASRRGSSAAASGDGSGGASGVLATDSANSDEQFASLESQLQDLEDQFAQSGAGGGSGGGTTGTTGDGGGGTGTGDGGGGTGTGTGTGGGGTGGNPLDKLHQTTVGGKGATRTLWQIAHDNGITEDQLIKLNPQLKKYVGSKKPIPKRQKITV